MIITNLRASWQAYLQSILQVELQRHSEHVLAHCWLEIEDSADAQQPVPANGAKVEEKAMLWDHVQLILVSTTTVLVARSPILWWGLPGHCRCRQWC